MDAETRRTAKAMEGQRRQVTVMFTDMQGYTATSEKLGEDRTYQLMQMVFEAMVGAVHAHQGHRPGTHGRRADGLVRRAALEDAPVRACRAGLEIHECIAALGDKAEAQFGVRPKFRIGINTGPLVIGSIGDDMQMEFTALGDTVNYASRLESLAETGTVFISDATRALVEGYVDATDLGERTVKGKSEPHRVHRLEGLKAGMTRFDVSVARLKLLERQRGATVAQLQKATGWQPHSVRAALTGLRKKDHGIRREQSEKGVTVYKTAER